MTSAGAWAAWAIVIPLAGASASFLAGRRGVVVALAAVVATVGTVVMVAWKVAMHGPALHKVGGWGAPLGIELHVDGPAALLLSVFGTVGALTCASALGYFPAGRRRTSFFALWLLGWAALNALLLSADVFNLYVTLELLTLVAVGLISLESTRESIAAALQYLFVALLGSLGYLLGVALLYGECATLDIELLGHRLEAGAIASAAFVLIAGGLSLKSALFPMHAWLPDAYSSAPVPASALLSGLFGKAAFFVLYRVVSGAFPLTLGPASTQWIGAQGGAAVVWSSLLALRQQRLKRLIAYSSLAQVGYLFLALPLGTPLARTGALYVAISHATASSAMFTAAGALERALGSDSLHALSGAAHRHPLAFFSLAIGGVSLMGLPPTGGFIAKWLLVRAALESGQWWWAVVVLTGGLIAAAYVFRILRTAVAPLASWPATARAAPGSEILSFVLALLTLLLGIAPSWLLALATIAGGGGT